MTNIAPNFDSLGQYLQFVKKNGPAALRPSKCPHSDCGKANPWCHGSYERKADRENSGPESLNPVPVFRYFCKLCKRTCSVLPWCISPRRWYLWAVQQAVLLLLISGYSQYYIACKLPPGRSTIKRWNLRLEQMFKLHTFYLCSRFPVLGRSLGNIFLFWGSCLNQMSLARAMYWIHHAGEIIP
jgi:hypothetical protein